jgi:hypothetical protein
MLDTFLLQEDIQRDPIKHCYDEILGCTYYDLQAEITKSVFKNQRTSVASCHASGKTYIAPRIALAFLLGHKNSIVITTAPTFKQVENGLWRELHSAYGESKVALGSTLLKTRFDIAPKWYAIGVASENPDNFQGFHEKDVLIIVDETGGVNPASLSRLNGLMTSANAHLLYIGNPTTANGEFYNSHHGKGSQFYTKFRITVFNTPNFTFNGIKNTADLRKFETREEVAALPLPYPQLVTPVWAWERLFDWGEETPIFQALVLAQFPQENEYNLISLSSVCEAIEKEFTDSERSQWPRSNALGIDVARKGSNETVFTGVNNCDVLDIQWHQGKDLMKTVGKAVNMFNELGFNKKQDKMVIDDTGVGGGVTDRLLELGYNVIAVNFGSSSSDSRFINLKTEMYWNLRQKFMDKEISIIDKGKLVGQLPTIEYEFNSQGVMSIQSKKKITKEKRLEMNSDSPDYADSLALAIWGSSQESDGDFYSGEDEPEENTSTVAGNLHNEVY